MSLCIKNKDGDIVKVAGSGGGGGTAEQITYDNTISELTAVNVQSAVDELAENKADKSEISSVENRLNTRIDVALGDIENALEAML